MHSHKLFRFYRRRQTIENFFKETKQSFNSGKMPSQKFRGNEAYLWFVCIAYNVSIWFKPVLAKAGKRCAVKEILTMHDEDNPPTPEYISSM
jgi:IS4 transposase